MPIPDPPGLRAKPPPISRRVVVVGAAVLGLTLTAILFDGRRPRMGELLVQSDRGDLRVTIKRGGHPVAGPTEKRSFTLPPGDYEIEAEGVPTGRISIVRGGRAVWKLAEAPTSGP